MAFYGQYTGFGGGGALDPTFINMIIGAGLTTDLELCLDAADGNSYTSGQDWVDVSGSGNADEFFRGSGTGSDSQDPTFNGVAGAMSSAEYWSFDGGDEFEYGATAETWMQNMHKNNADFSMLCAYYQPAGNPGVSGIFGDCPGGAHATIGVTFSVVGASRRIKYGVARGDLSGWPNSVRAHDLIDFETPSVDTALNSSAWNIIGMSLDEAAGSGGGFHYLNGSYNQTSGSDTFDATYYGPSSSAATNTFHVGSGSAGDPYAANGSRLAAIAFWSTSLTKANFDSIYTQLATRYGL